MNKLNLIGWFVLGLVALLLAVTIVEELLSEPLIPPYPVELERPSETM